MNMPTSVRIHVLGLGLSYDDAYTLARNKGVPERYLETHDVDDALNTYFARRGHATYCIDLLPHERPVGTDFEYCIITNFRIVSHHNQKKSAWDIFEERPREDEWTQRVCEALLPGADLRSMLMRLTLEDWGAAPMFIERFYKHQSCGKPMVQADGLSPDQTDYNPIIKERDARLSAYNQQYFAAQAAARSPTKSRILPALPPLPTPPACIYTAQAQKQKTMKTAPLGGCESDEGYFSDRLVRDHRL
ncbi:hypothetical protein PENSPDRAFT_692443 [Peniophora sp. CONT]|nr:hypothetical protein PENSPDRAFT_692443 [Peniophora sp. CONT]